MASILLFMYLVVTVNIHVMEQINRGEYQDSGIRGFRPSGILVVCEVPFLYNAKHTV